MKGQKELFPAKTTKAGKRKEHKAWHLSPRKRLIGRAGVAQAQEALNNATPYPERIRIPTTIEADGESITIHEVDLRKTAAGRGALTLKRHRVKKGSNSKVSAVLQPESLRALAYWILEHF